MIKEENETRAFTLEAAFAVCSPIELDTQPYRYSDGHFEWVENEKEVDKAEEK